MTGAGWLLLLAVLATAGRGQGRSDGKSATPRGGRRVRRPLRGIVGDGLGVAREHGPHQGFDIYPTEGDRTVYAYGPGTVADIIDGRGSALEARRRAGLYIDVAGDDGSLHRYLHLDRVSVQKGQRVRRDQPIATVAGSHLHFEIRRGRQKYGEPMVPDFG